MNDLNEQEALWECPGCREVDTREVLEVHQCTNPEDDRPIALLSEDSP